jgi:hypothetical protein
MLYLTSALPETPDGHAARLSSTLAGQFLSTYTGRLSERQRLDVQVCLGPLLACRQYGAVRAYMQGIL